MFSEDISARIPKSGTVFVFLNLKCYETIICFLISGPLP